MPIVENINGKGGGYKSVASMRSLISYAIQSHKTEQCHYTDINGVYSYGEITPDSAGQITRTFMADKEVFGKTDGYYCFHTVISFHPDEGMTPKKALEYGLKFAAKNYPNHQSLVAVHTDRKHLHIHIITNSVSFVDGKKISETQKTYRAKQRLNDRLAKEYGLTITEKGKHYDKTPIEPGTVRGQSQYAHTVINDDSKDSYMRSLAMDVTAVQRKATSRQEFIDMMDEQGWAVDWSDSRKYITFTMKSNPDIKVRDKRLNKTFNLNISKEELTHDFERVAGLAENRTVRSGMETAQTRVDELNRELDRDDQGFTERERRANSRTREERKIAREYHEGVQYLKGNHGLTGQGSSQDVDETWRALTQEELDKYKESIDTFERISALRQLIGRIVELIGRLTDSYSLKDLGKNMQKSVSLSKLTQLSDKLDAIEESIANPELTHREETIIRRKLDEIANEIGYSVYANGRTVYKPVIQSPEKSRDKQYPWELDK